MSSQTQGLIYSQKFGNECMAWDPCLLAGAHQPDAAIKYSNYMPLEDASIRDISLEKTSWENETTVLQNAVFLNQQPLSGALPLMGRIVGSRR